MSNDTPVDPRNVTQPDAPTLDSAGKPVNVIQRDLTDPDNDTRAVDEIITPTSIREKEQDAEELNKKSAEIERKVADGR
ncbi:MULTISPECIES: hypothetical protein [unclassified Pseudomonas]|uniref:hypothetical protein n=1 Tax=unclassified Pseudomonas TaxID=196821 RepID=UPI001224336D|nr:MULTISPECIES: hypothetical protein [unclassified Pseudomonas]MBD8597534.1 hypothetical protein [Pseudomonas sp. CFBP 8772]RZI71969.1 MAG: hypothetical protein EOP13_16535 [Pseudomonas sp.]